MEKKDFGTLRKAVREQAQRNAEAKQQEFPRSEDVKEASDYFRELAMQDSDTAKYDQEWKAEEWEVRREIGSEAWTALRVKMSEQWKVAEENAEADMGRAREIDNPDERDSALLKIYDGMAAKVRDVILRDPDIKKALGEKTSRLSEILKNLHKKERKIFVHTFFASPD